MRKTLHFKNLRSFLVLGAFLFLCINGWGQAYKEDFGNTATVAIPYTSGTNATGSVIKNTNFTNPVWNQSIASANFAGNTLGAMSATMVAGGAYTVTCTFTVAANYQFNPTSVGFDNRASTTGPTALTISISGTGGSTNVSLTPSKTGAFTTTAATNFASTVQNLTGAVTLTFAYTGATSGSTVRLDNVILNGTVTATPTITGAATATAFTTTYGTVSTAQSFVVSGSNLTANLVATAPTGFEVSSDNITYGSTSSYTQTAGSASGTVYIRLKATAAVSGSYNSQNIVLSSTGATSVNITTSASANAVTAKGLTITGLSGANKIYDGTTAAASSGTAAYSGLVNGESFSVAGTPGLSFASAGIGTGIAITVSGYTAPSTNYTLTQPAGLTADITSKTLTITGLTADNKVFDGTTTATLSGTATLAGVVAGDAGNVTVAGPYTADFSQSAVGTGLAVTVSGYTISGSASGNYTLTQPTGLTANITSSATPVITSGLTASATYGVASTSYFITATNTPTSYSASGLPAGLSVDTITGEISGTPTANIGSYNVTISAINGGGNGSATLVYTITAKVLTLAGATANSKIYDKITAATVTGTLTGVVGADVVTYSGTGTFASVNIGTAIVVTSTSTLGGANAGNYTLTQPTGITADIVVKTLTVSGAIATSRAYNGLIAASITGATLVGVVAGDVVTVSGGGTFASADVGTGIVVTPALTLGGANSGNYILTQPTGLTADITVAPLTITGLTGVNKVYDATTVASVSGTAAYLGLQNGEIFTVTGTPAYAFATKTVGAAKPIMVTGYTAPTSNYTVTQPAAITANITVATLTVTGAIANNKVYDGTTAATLSGGSLSGVLLSDMVNLGSGTGTFSQSNVGTGLTVTASYTKSGADAGNYTLTQPTGTADITKANQTIVFGALAPKTTADIDYSPGATSTTSGTNPITYVSSNPAVATIIGSNIHITGVGTTTITASQAGNANYFAATDVAQSLTVTLAPIVLAGWDLFGQSSPVSFAATTFNSNLVSTSAQSEITRGAGAISSAGGSSFRTTGFQNNGISTANTDYFQTTLKTTTGYSLNLSTITANLVGTATFSASPGVSSQFAYSLDGTTFTLIGSPTILIGATPAAMPSVNLTGITALQNVPSGTTVYIRYYATGQTTTGGWGFSSASAGTNGLAFSGNILCLQPAAFAVTGGGTICTGSGTAVGLANSQAGINYQLKLDGTNTGSPVAGTGAAISFGNQTLAGTYTVFASNVGAGCSNTATMTGSATVTVNPLPTATISGTATVCQNATAPDITFTGANGTAPYTFTYTINGGSNQTVTTVVGNSVTVSVPTGTSGTFSYNLVSIAGQFCSQAQTGSATVTVKTPAGITSITAASNPVCSGSTTTLTANGVTGDNASVTWWTGSGGTGTNLETGSTFVAGAGTYYAYVTGDCGTTAEASVTVTTVNNSWTGAISTSWNDNGNWSCGLAPTLSTVVIIPAVTNQPVISTSASAYSLTIDAGASLTVPSGTNLTVTDVIVNAGTVTIENNANLIQINDVANTGAITVKRNSALLVRLDHTLWSSPVANQNLFGFSPQTLTNRFYVYNTPTNTYVTTGLSAASVFTPAKGFAVRAPNNYTTTPQVWEGIFTGVPNNGAKTYTLDTATDGYNLVGNPYPSAMNATTFVNAITNPAINGTLYFYAHTLTMNASGQFPAGTNYAMWNSGSGGVAATVGTSGVPANVPNGIIQAGQGFLVKATSSGTVNFTNAMRVGNNANQFFRANATTAVPLERHRLWFNLTDATGSTFNQIMVAYAEGATQGVDRDYDGLAYGNTGSALSSKIGVKDFTIQGRSLPFDSADVVPLGFKAGTAGNYTISLSMMDGLFLDSQEVFIRDITTGLVHDIKSAPYTFYSDAGTFNRFEVVYANTLAVSNNTFDKASVVVYKNHGVFHVNTKSITMKEIVVFDINGRMIFKQSGINSNTTTLSGLNTNTAALLFKIVSENEETVTVKVLN